MSLAIDHEKSVLTLGGREYPLYSRESFEALSREWVRIGWALHYYFTFSWGGQPILQLPEDLIRVQEVIHTLQPEIIIETGVFGGGSMLFHATLCEAAGKGHVIGIDQRITDETRSGVANHRLANRIKLIEGDSAAPGTVDAVRRLVGPRSPVMILLDSDHTRAHVRNELEAYAPLVTPGSCIVAADGIMRDLADVPGGGGPDWIENNPASAAHDFLAGHSDEFEMREPAWRFNRGPLKNNITYWPDGWLWRKP